MGVIRRLDARLVAAHQPGPPFPWMRPVTTHNLSAALVISQELGFTIATEDADALVRFIRNAYHRGAADALPGRHALVAQAVAAEREACAQVCDARASNPVISNRRRCDADALAAAIRARGSL